MSANPLPFELQVFDPHAEFAVIERRLPHWSQSGVIAFITWRTNDSIPADVLQEWRAERHTWLYRHGIKDETDGWKAKLRCLPNEMQSEFHRMFSDRWHEALDACHGSCVLRRDKLARIVSDSLLHFDGDRYELTDFVVMPNHVHLLAIYRDAQGMLSQQESWKHFQAVQINRVLGQKGRFWQQDGFDHLVRSEEQFQYLRSYIAENGRKAGLAPGDYLHYSKPLSLE